MAVGENTQQPSPTVATVGTEAETMMRHAAAAHRAGRLAEAVSIYGRLLQRFPFTAELHNNIGVALRGLGLFDTAIAHYRQSLTLDPSNAAHHSNLGNALRSIGRCEEALQHHFRAVAIADNYVEGFFNLGLTLRDMGRLEEAQGCFQRALHLAPDHVRARVEIAVTKLMRGDFAAGFAEYEARKLLPDHPQPEFREPSWSGEDLAGKRLLLYPEQGLFDALHFARYVPLLRGRGARVVALVQPLLRDILRLSGLFDEVVPEGDPLPAFDLHCSMLSLPALLGPHAAPAPVPYLKAPAQNRIRLGAHARTKLKVGIFWAALPGNTRDRNRSCPLDELLALADNPEVLLFSLQGGAAQKDIEQIGASALVHDVGRGIFDFAEAATVLTQLDLLITIDAPIAHLAGAMGLPAWVLLPHTADWRWMVNRADSPWYPSLRLFRQPAPGDWRATIAQVRTSLGALLSAAM